MKNENEIQYINHCDDCNCDLGSAEFNCPSCEKLNINYDELWWNRDFITIIKIKCEFCKIELTAFYENGFKISTSNV